MYSNQIMADTPHREKEIFLGQKCNMCHGASSAGITPTGKIKAPDLTGLAAKVEPGLAQQVPQGGGGHKKGKKHVKPFTGTDEELGALVACLQRQAPAEE